MKLWVNAIHSLVSTEKETKHIYYVFKIKVNWSITYNLLVYPEIIALYFAVREYLHCEVCFFNGLLLHRLLNVLQGY